MKKLPKLINRYTSSKDYYSYEKDYLYLIKSTLLKEYNIDELKFLVKRIRSYDVKSFENIFTSSFFNVRHDGDGVQSVLSFLALSESYLSSFPCYYVDNSFIDLALNTELPQNYDLKEYFTEKAIFLFPKTCYYKFAIFDINNFFGITVPFFYDKKNQRSSCLFLWQDENKKGSRFLRDSNKYNVSNIVLYLLPHIFLYMSVHKKNATKIIKQHSTNGIGFKQGKSRLLTPPTIGFSEKEYVENQHRLVSIPNPNLQGIKKQTHWRRGHWRQYDDGKLTWVRPCLINPIAD